jgi:hypothetical protein
MPVALLAQHRATQEDAGESVNAQAFRDGRTIRWRGLLAAHLAGRTVGYLTDVFDEIILVLGIFSLYDAAAYWPH